MRFADIGLSDELLKAVTEAGYDEPTPIQAAAIPQVQMMRDIIAIAQTGTGKTASFVLPMIDVLANGRARARMPRSLVLAPTRELANQVATEITTIGKHKGVRCLPIYGGVGYGPPNEGLAAGAHVVVGTPGRILDHLGNARLKLDRLKFFVLDEADELLSLGFWPDMREIEKYLPPKEARQTCLFSATMP